MKKLLSLLGIASLSVSASSLVVACSNGERVTNPKLNLNIVKDILVKLSGDSSLANIDFGSLFDSSQITSVVVNMINELISLQYSFDSTNSKFKTLNFEEYALDNNGKIEETFKNQYDIKSRTIAEDNLFTEYTQSITKNNRLDYKNVQDGYALNPIQDKTVVKNSENISITIAKSSKIYISSEEPTSSNKDEKIWQFATENGSNSPNLPKIEDLTSEFKEGSNGNFYVEDQDGKMQLISSKTALYLRFQDYFESKLLEDINANLLTNSFLDSNMFNIKKNTNAEAAPYINPSSALFSKTQTLKEISGNEKWETNVKMVWTLRFDNTNGNTIKNKIRDIFEGSNIIQDKASGALDVTKSIKEIYELFTETADAPSIITNEKDAYDPYFGLSGFQGFTLYENGSSIGTSPISGKSYEDAVKNWTHGSGVLKSTDGSWSFADSENKNYEVVVVVLPIYMIELLGASNDSSSNYYSINGKKDEEKSIIKFSNTISNETVYKDRWNAQDNKELHSKDIKDISLDKTQQEAMLNQIKYLVSNDSSTSELSKTVLYSMYLDEDQVYYAGLYDQIGKYIKNNDDEDD
ncbi:hypothetical protein [Spiroplasma taiwanense]|uniref:Lipoprotein n=1 Tax=Spiroplasma taiwanense CT-1 TaxID=1276220 RepID=S5LY17_9MOLU|nr:hypothetical protein [Spiroplasma taiwanense]AGR41496.1 hypothetical protein STAIW_v1c09100 [Spiroplasma taiwanense CT-1]